MKLQQSQSLSQSLQLKQFLSPYLIQQFKILQKSFLKLNEAISEIVSENIMLEYQPMEYTFSSSSDLIDISKASSTLNENLNLIDYLLKQLKLLGVSERDYQILYQLIESLDDRGFLLNFDSLSLQLMKKFNVPKSHLRHLLGLIQDFEPDGVGARNLSECLSIQIKHYDFDQDALKQPLLLIVSNHLTELSEKKYDSISKKTKLSIEAIELIANFIKVNLTPNPGASFSSKKEVLIRPSFSIKNKSGRLEIINHEQQRTSGLRISSNHDSLINQAKNDPEAKTFLQNQLNKAEQFLESIQQRNEKLNMLIHFISHKQEAAFTHGLSYLVPLQQSILSQHLNLSASMISRTLAQKYIETDYGILSLKQLCPRNYFGLTKDRFIELISSILSEKPTSSDAEISRFLKQRGIDIARRTVAKYRQLLDVPARFPAVGTHKKL